MDALRKWQLATQGRARHIVRDWQIAQRVRLTKESAEDLADRIASGLIDAVSVGAQATKPKGPGSDSEGM